MYTLYAKLLNCMYVVYAWRMTVERRRTWISFLCQMPRHHEFRCLSLLGIRSYSFLFDLTYITCIPSNSDSIRFYSIQFFSKPLANRMFPVAQWIAWIASSVLFQVLISLVNKRIDFRTPFHRQTMTAQAGNLHCLRFFLSLAMIHWHTPRTMGKPVHHTQGP